VEWCTITKLTAESFFYTARPLGPPGTSIYALDAIEFAIVDNTIVVLETNFTNDDPQYGVFNRTILTSGEIDYHNQKIWFLDVGNPELISFNVSDLNDYKFIPLPGAYFMGVDDAPTAYSAAFDFGSQLAYVVSNPDSTNHFNAYQVDLHHKNIRHTRSYQAEYGNVAGVYLDVAQGNLYVGFFGGNTTKLGVINTSNLHLEYLHLY